MRVSAGRQPLGGQQAGYGPRLSTGDTLFALSRYHALFTMAGTHEKPQAHDSGLSFMEPTPPLSSQDDRQRSQRGSVAKAENLFAGLQLDDVSLSGDEMECTTPSLYSIQDEELPEERIYDPRLQDSLRDVRAQLTRLTDTMRKPKQVQDNDHTSNLYSLYQEAEELCRFQVPESRVGFIGDTGVGWFISGGIYLLRY